MKSNISFDFGWDGMNGFKEVREKVNSTEKKRKETKLREVLMLK